MTEPLCSQGGAGWARPEALPVDVPKMLGGLRRAWENSPAAITLTFGPRHLLVYQNSTSRALFGERRLGIPLAQAFAQMQPGVMAELDVVFASGRVVVRDRHKVGMRDPSGREVYVRYVVCPYGPEGEPPTGLAILAVDLSGEARAELASNRAALLARLTERVNAAQDPASALQALTDVLVPELADVAAVYVLPDVDWRQPPGGRPAVPEAMTLSPALLRLGPPPAATARRASPSRWDEMLAAGRPVLIPFEDGARDEVAPDTDIRAWMVAAGTRNLAAAPLAVAGRLVGAMLLVAAGQREPYTEAILPFLTDIAARAGVAVAQVREHRQQADVSRRLQHALLPAAPPLVPGLHVAARYLAGAEDVDVGGDWWDVVLLDERHVAIGVGDVSGRGVDAAIVMGQARAAMRTASLAGLSPAQVLGLLDRQVADLVTAPAEVLGAEPQFATALHAVIDLSTGRTRLASAGHPPPLVHDGRCACPVPVVAGVPLGLKFGGYEECTIEIPRGGSLLMFTDGLVEDRSRDLDVGLSELAGQVNVLSDQDVETALDKILGAMGATGPHMRSAADDVAVVLARRQA